MTFEFRNPRYNQYGTIDCEIFLQEPERWVWTTASPDDFEAATQELHAAIISSGVSIAPYAAVIYPDQVNAERDRRIATTFTFQGVLYQCDEASQQNLIAKGAQAKFAIKSGAAAGDLRWSDPNQDFGWIATDNSIVPMDAPTMAAFADAADLWVTSHFMAARALKNATPIPTDYATNASYWPS